MDKPDAWFPHYIGDYAIETMHLTAQQDGIYMRLKSFYWKNGGPIPADQNILLRVTRLYTQHEVEDLLLVLKSNFRLVDDRYIHDEMDKRYKNAWTLYLKKSAAGKKAVAERERKKREMKSTDLSDDDQTRTTTRTTIKDITEKDNDAAASLSKNASEKMTISEFKKLHLATFGNAMDDNLAESVAKYCKEIPKERIQAVFAIAAENGIEGFRHIQQHFNRKYVR